MFLTRHKHIASYKRMALLFAYEGRKDRLVWNLCVLVGHRLIK